MVLVQHKIEKSKKSSRIINYLNVLNVFKTDITLIYSHERI